MNRNQTDTESEALIQNLLAWLQEQPEYATGEFPDKDRLLNGVDKLRLARYAEQVKNLLGDDLAIEHFITAIGTNNVTATVLAMTGLLDVLAKIAEQTSEVIKIPKRFKRARHDDHYALSQNPNLDTEEKRYEWLKEYGTEGGKSPNYSLQTFKDYLRGARRCYKKEQDRGAACINKALRNAVDFHMEQLKASSIRSRLTTNC